MTTATQEAPEGERLARIEATLELLLRQNADIKEYIRALTTNVSADMRDVREEIRDVRKESRARFFWVLGILLGIIAPSLIGLLATVILNG